MTTPELTDEMIQGLLLLANETFLALQPPDGADISVVDAVAYMGIGVFIMHELGVPPAAIMRIAQYLAERPPPSGVTS